WLVAFLFQGNYANGCEALTRTFLISGLVIGLDLLLKIMLMRYMPNVYCLVSSCGKRRSLWLMEEDVNLENVYYSEMKDAGFFDADWE
ncbi:hypothetical protein HID58_020134, partial [Brassica napus]